MGLRAAVRRRERGPHRSQRQIEAAGLEKVVGYTQGDARQLAEHLPDPDFSSLSTLRAFVEPEGFEFAEHFGPPWSYTANFRRSPVTGVERD